MHASGQDLLVEIGTEELPPKALRALRNAFEVGVCNGLKQQNIVFNQSVGELASPRRLGLLITDVAECQPDQQIELLGPAVAAAFQADGTPTGAAIGFSRKVGVEISDLQQVDGPKGPRLAHISTKQGRPTKELLPAIINKALAELPIPKRMRWGANREEFVRPVHWVLMLLGSDKVEGEVLGLKTAGVSRGHRFHANKEITVRSAAAYVETLKNQGKVQVDYAERMETIRNAVAKLAEDQLGGRAVISDALLEEVSALVEWPVPLAGTFEDRFLAVPPEALISSMKEHQKYFHVVDANNELLPNFITVANIESSDPSGVIDGNERVIRPRLADAAFFFATDKKVAFTDFRDRLKPIVFQEKLGSIYDKTERIAALAKQIAPSVLANAEDSARAGQLSKCDLVSNMVLEFDDLQGTMGRYYAQASGESSEVAQAIFEQYLPRFAGDILPSTATGTAVALADRLDTLTGIFGIGQIPTGSKDPFALRRASLGVLRILVESNYQVSLRELINSALKLHTGTTLPQDETESGLLAYMLDRFAAWFADMNIAAEVFLSVRALEIDNPSDIYARVLAVAEFSKSDDANALAAANKRVANILAKAGELKQQQVNPALLEQDAEKALFKAIENADKNVRPRIESADYEGALTELAGLRAVVDLFFEEVMVMADQPEVRCNRLCLLQKLRQLFLSIADISLLPTKD